MPGILSADYKVPGGKLCRVRLRVLDGIIQEIRITGDFFMHPEGAIEDLERLIAGIRADEVAIRRAVQAFYSQDVEVIGADADDFVAVILLALKSA